MVSILVNEVIDCKRYIRENSSIYFTCILLGKSDGIIWADQKESPNFLLLWSPYQEGFQFMGKPLDREDWGEFRVWFDRTIVLFLREQGLNYFEYACDTKELEEMLQEIFKDRNLLSDDQKMFSWSGTGAQLSQPNGYRIEKVDREFLQKDYRNKEFIVDEINSAYANKELFSKEGIFYVALLENEVVARADMLFCDEKYGNISVKTEEKHRKKGLSAYLTMKVIEDTYKQGLIPIWDCTNDNLASEMTAKKCGFQMIRKDTVSWFKLDDYK